jgi:hypothetical protein
MIINPDARFLFPVSCFASYEETVETGAKSTLAN